MSWLAYALLSTMFVAFSSIFEKLGLRQSDTLLVTTIQSFITSIVLLISCIVLKRLTSTTLTSLMSHSGLSIMLAATITAVSWFFYAKALKHGHVSKVESVDRLSLLFTIVLSAFILGEPLEFKNIAGGVLMAIGAWLIIVGV